MIPKHSIQITVNGVTYHRDVEPRTTLVDFLRDDLALTGTHVGCEHGVCGACSVLLEGQAVRSCCLFAVQANGQEVVTVEGLTQPNSKMSRLQDAFCEKHGLQCGYCTPGMLVACAALLDEHPTPSKEQVREAISGNLCRCTGYQQIVEAVMYATTPLGVTLEDPREHPPEQAPHHTSGQGDSHV
jgi:aerobic carbon-monoxide dehydrogenase small subunit